MILAPLYFDMATSDFDARLGPRFTQRAEALFSYLKARPGPCLSSEQELAKALGDASVRSVRRYLRFLKACGKIEIAYVKFQYRNPPRHWFNRREITVLEEK